MEGQTITTKFNDEDGSSRVIVLQDPFAGKDYASLCEVYGEDQVLESAVAQLRVKFQASVRGMMKAGKDDDAISSEMASWKPGQRANFGADPKAVIMRNFGNLTPEQRAQLIALLQQQS